MPPKHRFTRLALVNFDKLMLPYVELIALVKSASDSQL